MRNAERKKGGKGKDDFEGIDYRLKQAHEWPYMPD